MVGTMANLIVCPGGMDSSIYAWVPSPGIEDHNNSIQKPAGVPSVGDIPDPFLPDKQDEGRHFLRPT